MIELLKIFGRMLLRNIGLWISLILAVCFFSLWCCFSADGNFSDLYINLAASFFAALLTIVLIEGVKEKCLFTRICGRNPVPGVRQAGDISTLLQF